MKKTAKKILNNMDEFKKRLEFEAIKTREEQEKFKDELDWSVTVFDGLGEISKKGNA